MMRFSVRARFVAATVAMVLAVLMTSWALAVSANAASPPTGTARTVVNNIHTDSVDVQYVDGNLRLQTRMGNSSNYSFADPGEVVFQLFDNEFSAAAVPDIAEYSFLGEVGTPLWLAPQTQIEELLWPGWDTESLPSSLFVGDAVDIHLRRVIGPGRVELFQTDPAGLPIRNFSSADPAFTTVHQPVGSHVHANWAFGALGRYTLTFEVTATVEGGATLSSGWVDYTWFVGGTSAADVVAQPTTTTVSVQPGSPASVGSTVTVTGSVQPVVATGWIEFFDGDVSLGYGEIADGVAAVSVDSLSAGEHSITARFTPRYTNDFLSSLAPSLTYRVDPAGPTPTVAPSATATAQPTPTTTATPPTTPTASPTASTNAPATTSSTQVVATSTSESCVATSRATGIVLDQGHVDYGTRIVGGKLVSQIKDGTVAGTTTWRDASQVVLQLKQAAATTIPATGFGFLGAAGSTIWQIPQTQKAGVAWLGWNTEELSASQVSGPVSWRLTSVTGPGAVAVYEYDAFGTPKVIFNSADGAGDSYPIPLGTHAHGNWAFTKSGAYKVTFAQSATLASGVVASDTRTVTFAVGDTDPVALLPKTTTTSCGGQRLPTTGVSLVAPLFTGSGLLAAGAAVVIVLAVRRRRDVSRVAISGSDQYRA